MSGNTWKGMAEAFEIFSRYATEDDGGSTAAEHDEIYAGPSPSVMSEEDMIRIEELGWLVDDEFDCWKKFT
jgi:hypothetical protein